MNKFWMWLFHKVVSHIKYTSTTAKYGYHERCFRDRKYNITVTHQRRGIPRMYTREELVVMLRTIRREEKKAGWKVPEPDEFRLIITPQHHEACTPKVCHIDCEVARRGEVYLPEFGVLQCSKCFRIEPFDEKKIHTKCMTVKLDGRQCDGILHSIPEREVR